MDSITFKPAGDANGVGVSLPETDEYVYVDEKGYTTDDEFVVAALDANPAVARASAPSAGSSTPKEN
jgi:hypothetical protein